MWLLLNRSYTKWEKAQTALVTSYFKKWIESDGRGLPCKKDIERFLKHHGNVVTVQWTVIRTKVFNEKMAFAKRKKSVLDSLASCHKGFGACKQYQ